MTERDDTEIRPPEESGAGEASRSQGGAAVAEGAQEAVDPKAAERPAPALDPSAATPEREPSGGPAGAANERPEILVAGAFVGGLVAAMVLKRVARG